MAHPPLDEDGYLQNLGDWSPEVAQWLASQHGIALTNAHHEIITLLREFYASTGVAPANRPLVKLVQNRLGAERGNSIYLMQLFPGGPAKIACKIAGLPRPDNCL